VPILYTCHCWSGPTRVLFNIVSNSFSQPNTDARTTIKGFWHLNNARLAFSHSRLIRKTEVHWPVCCLAQSKCLKLLVSMLKYRPHCDHHDLLWKFSAVSKNFVIFEKSLKNLSHRFYRCKSCTSLFSRSKVVHFSWKALCSLFTFCSLLKTSEIIWNFLSRLFWNLNNFQTFFFL